MIVTAAGDELALAHPSGHAETAVVWLILGGPALFLAGIAWFKHAVFAKVSVPRITGLALLAATAAGAGWLSPLALSVLASTILVTVALWETVTLPPDTSHLHGHG